MQNNDKAVFKTALETCFANYREPAPLDAVVDDWMGHLTPYNIMQVGNAIEHHKRNSRRTPVLADILALLPKDPADWPEAPTAFSEMLQIEGGQFALTTREHLAAFEVARPLLEARERFNASKAFVERYESMVTAAKNGGLRAAWFVSSSGSDHDGVYRREALRDGVRSGRITKEQGVVLAALLPPPPDKVPPYDADGNLPALSAPPAPSNRIQSEVEKLRATLGRMNEPATEWVPEVAEPDPVKAESARKVAEFLAARPADDEARKAAERVRQDGYANAFARIMALARLSDDGKFGAAVRAVVAEQVAV
ncbi:hypothetical protein LMG28727_00825 [Paraburkholderia kirstenboschensis]|uniref:hypothetical protein n=1 Tax=Paraburkholderia kirstenboschensis TaxID=1245436 RepID=UPI000A40ABA2|nr:hypothetical protein [Paraburkholderia kirstenboschensis]CAD6514050.1 hypothetical protein LMG28727_00825 [Paraburkholderia kirstenboschensis]